MITGKSILSLSNLVGGDSGISIRAHFSSFTLHESAIRGTVIYNESVLVLYMYAQVDVCPDELCLTHIVNKNRFN